MITIRKRHGQTDGHRKTDGRTDGETTYSVAKALCVEKCDKNAFMLARALQALSDPYCQSTCLCCVGNFDAKYLGN